MINTGYIHVPYAIDQSIDPSHLFTGAHQTLVPKVTTEHGSRRIQIATGRFELCRAVPQRLLQTSACLLQLGIRLGQLFCSTLVFGDEVCVLDRDGGLVRKSHERWKLSVEESPWAVTGFDVQGAGRSVVWSANRNASNRLYVELVNREMSRPSVHLHER